MANLTPASTFDNVYQIEQTDVARGGAGNLANSQAQSLINRTQWLKDAMRGYIGFTFITGTQTLVLADILQRMVVINAISATNAIITLPALNNTTDVGTRLNMMAYNVVTQVTVRSAGTNDIIFGAAARQSLFMGNADTIEMVWTGTNWLLINYAGNFADVSKLEYGYYILPNTVVADGSLLNRIDYPRLWECINTFLSGTSLISDTTWSTISGNKGFFSTGNGSTTFRVPDLRSMFIRGLDLGSGLDFGRINNNPGGYEADDLKSHSHLIWGQDNAAPPTGVSSPEVSNIEDPGTSSAYFNRNTGLTGGVETRPKNIGLIPLIKV